MFHLRLKGTRFELLSVWRQQDIRPRFRETSALPVIRTFRAFGQAVGVQTTQSASEWPLPMIHKPDTGRPRLGIDTKDSSALFSVSLVRSPMGLESDAKSGANSP
jgi:hypothetical protein